MITELTLLSNLRYKWAILLHQGSALLWLSFCVVVLGWLCCGFFPFFLFHNFLTLPLFHFCRNFLQDWMWPRAALCILEPMFFLEGIFMSCDKLIMVHLRMSILASLCFFKAFSYDGMLIWSIHVVFCRRT